MFVCIFESHLTSSRLSGCIIASCPVTICTFSHNPHPVTSSIYPTPRLTASSYLPVQPSTSPRRLILLFFNLERQPHLIHNGHKNDTNVASRRREITHNHIQLLCHARHESIRCHNLPRRPSRRWFSHPGLRRQRHHRHNERRNITHAQRIRLRNPR